LNVSGQELAYSPHFVCTRGEAVELVCQYDTIWLADCGCRGESCERSRRDVCIWFTNSPFGNPRPISRDEALAVIEYAAVRNLVFRPFRDTGGDPNAVDGICHCCNCCCSYFLNPSEPCDKGRYIEHTDVARCTHCGLCVEVCYPAARSCDGGQLHVEADKCYGCGLCVSACPEVCISMVKR
jgi:ferredoxin